MGREAGSRSRVKRSLKKVKSKRPKGSRAKTKKAVKKVKRKR
ncbi:MAG: hypothetical protein QXY70_01090 [Nanopusillaceae archaeon]